MGCCSSKQGSATQAPISKEEAERRARAEEGELAKQCSEKEQQGEQEQQHDHEQRQLKEQQEREQHEHREQQQQERKERLRLKVEQQQQEQAAQVAAEKQRQEEEAAQQRRAEEEQREQQHQEELQRREAARRKKLERSRHDVNEHVVTLQGFQDLIREQKDLAAVTPTEWMAEGKYRFLESVQEHQVLPPTYFCLISPDWGRSVKEVVDIVSDHIEEMEPGRAAGELGVWLSCLFENPDSSGEQQAAEAAEVERALQTAIPTLVCLEKPKMSTASSLGSGRGLFGGGGSGRQHSGLSASTRESEGGASTYTLQPVGSGSNIDLSASLRQADHMPTLKIYRSKAGLRGFQGAMFKSVRLVYLD